MLPKDLLEKVTERLNKHWTENGESPQETADLVRQYFPDKIEQILHNAQQALDGYLVLPGTGGKPYFVGAPPRWEDNPLNDNEYVWVLNRLEFFKTMLQAYLFTKSELYCRKVVSLLEDWIDNCKRPTVEYLITNGNPGRPISPWRTFEAGARMFDAWPFMMKVLLPTDQAQSFLLLL